MIFEKGFLCIFSGLDCKEKGKLFRRNWINIECDEHKIESISCINSQFHHKFLPTTTGILTNILFDCFLAKVFAIKYKSFKNVEIKSSPGGFLEGFEDLKKWFEDFEIFESFKKCSWVSKEGSNFKKLLEA